MTRTIAALIAAAMLANVSTPAAAQTKYYARERIVGVKDSAVEQQPTSPRSFFLLAGLLDDV